MSSAYGSIENDDIRVLRQAPSFAIDGFSEDVPDVSVRMAVPNHPMWHFVDDGQEIELYVTFAEGFTGIPYGNGLGAQNDDSEEFAYQVDLAGERVRLTPLMCFKARHCTMFKATIVVKGSRSRSLRPGQPVPFSLQYTKDSRYEVFEQTTVTEPNMPVYYQPVWTKLLERDNSMMRKIDSLEGNEANLNDTEEPGPSGASNGSCAIEQALLTRGSSLREGAFNRSTTPTILAQDDFFLYYTRRTCRPFLESQNPCLKFIKELMVTPLTNFTGLSLYYQLYLVEIFHVKFLTKLGHYLCMPMVVLLMATWCAQWRFIGSYKFEDISVFILNGTFVFILVLQVWYIFWGCLYKMYFFGIFMIWPLFFMYMCSNMLFQIVVINSYWIQNSNLTLAGVQKVWGENPKHWYDVITLAHFGVMWYLNPLLWALIFAAGQALSHAFEEKLPPRVSQTAHWLDLTTVLKQKGYIATSLIVVSQVIFGTLNEFVASPRLLPLLILRICYNLGYEEKQWVKFRMLVNECLKFGDPAIDYIGHGGASWPKHLAEWKPDELESTIQMIELGLSEEQKKTLKDPKFLCDEEKFTKELKYYVLLRHRLAKYKIQANAYGPFTPKVCGDLDSNDFNNVMIENDFPDNPAFRMFLKEARSHFAEMEYRFVTECKLNRVFL